MDKERLAQLATEFAKELHTSDELRSHMAEHQRRSERAQRLLNTERIPTLSEEELRELFFDTDAFSFWTNKEWEFNRRLVRVGLPGLRDALLELITRAEDNLTPEDLKSVWEMGGLGPLLSTELLCYRFPDRYWTYSPNVTLPAFRVLGLDVKAGLPRGQKGDAHVYLALREPMDQVVAALQAAGLSEADYSVADIFLWYLQSTKALMPQRLAEILRVGKRAVQPLAQTTPFLDQIAAMLQERIGEVETKVGAMPSKKEGERVQYLNAASFVLADHLLPAKVPGKAHPLFLHIRLSLGQLWWGVYAWGSQEAVKRLRNAFEQLGLIEEGDEVVVDTGDLGISKKVWPGGAYFALGRRMTADEVADQPNLESLAVAIVEDLAGYHERIAPRLGELRRIISGEEPGPDRRSEAFAPVDLRAVLGRSLTSHGLYFTDWQIATFYTALQTKGFVILSGISGTGKTKLAQHFAALLPQSPDRNWLFVPVRPDWRDSKSLLGYYNPLTGTYAWTPFLHFLLRAERSYRARDGLAWFVILDEMNLAHVEYYFADLLSVLESGRDEEGWTREPLRFDYPDEVEGDLPPRELHLPPNLYVIGTVNVDETTRAFSPKVLDRAFTLELTEVDFSAYPPASDPDLIILEEGERQALLDNFTFGGRFVRIDKQAIAEYVTIHPKVREWLKTLNQQLRPYGLHFGYRVFDEIVAFLIAAQHNSLYDSLGGTTVAFDAAVLMKVLPKFHGSRSKLEAPLKAVLAWCVNPDTPGDALREMEQDEDVVKAPDQLSHRFSFKMTKTAERVQRMLWELYTTGFTAFG